MTITEEIDKKSGRPYRSKNIVDAMRYAGSVTATPKNIADAVKIYSDGEGIFPTGTEVITDNGTYDITEKATVDVQVYAKVGSAIVGGE